LKKSPHPHFIALLLMMIALLCWNCGSKQARYYMLSATPDPSPVSSSVESITVGVDPVGLPDYLRRPEIVTRLSDSEVDFAEFDRWAESLEETMVRVLVENLSGLLPGVNFLIYPWNRATPLDYRISVDVQSFELKPDGKVSLAADWRLRDGEGKNVRTEKAAFTAAVDGKGYEAIVSRALTG